MKSGPAECRRAERALAVLCVVAVLVLAVPSLPGASGRPANVASATARSSATFAEAAAVYSGSFAARAGYSGAPPASAAGLTPATGTQTAVISFYPSSPTFFTPPAVGVPPLSVAEIADRYGLSTAAYASAEAYFESAGLSVVHTNPDRLSLTVDGTAATMGQAFGTRLVVGTHDGRPSMFPETAPSLPAALESQVASVVGLTSGVDLFSLPAGLPSGLVPTANASPLSSDPPDLITPSIARQIYDLSPLYNVSGTPHFASGQGIALVLWGDGYSPSDLSVFFSTGYPSGFPMPVLQPFNLDGAPPPSNGAPSDPSKAPQELTLDLEWSGSMAPGATLDAVYVPDGPASEQYSPSVADITDAFTKAVTGIPGVSVVSMSFGTPENASQPLQAAWATDIAAAEQQGITLLAATGDTGGDVSANCGGGPSVEFPAVSPGVTAVGGTDPVLARNLLGQVMGLSSESAWSGSGGGYSAAITAPTWQLVGSAAARIQANGDHRGVPDVSAAATYNYLFYNGQDSVAAGTSFATPLWAGLVSEMNALYGSRLGFLTPRLYAIGAGQESGRDAVGIADVTSGSTCIGSATNGWDPETGWGSPRALLLYEDLTATFVNLTISASPSPVAPGASVKIVAYLSNRTSGAPIAGVPIAVSLASSTGDGPCAGTWGSSDLTTNASGAVELTVSVPVCYLGGHGTATATVTSDGYYGASSTTVAVNLLGFVPSLAGIQSYPENVVAFVLIMAIGSALGYVLGRPSRRPFSVAPPPGPQGPPAPPPSPPVATPATPTNAPPQNPVSAAEIPPGPTSGGPPPPPSA
jgi:kumamolisin